jgi:hypothetical protein
MRMLNRSAASCPRTFLFPENILEQAVWIFSSDQEMLD